MNESFSPSDPSTYSGFSVSQYYHLVALFHFLSATTLPEIIPPPSHVHLGGNFGYASACHSFIAGSINLCSGTFSGPAQYMPPRHLFSWLHYLLAKILIVQTNLQMIPFLFQPNLRFYHVLFTIFIGSYKGLEFLVRPCKQIFEISANHGSVPKRMLPHYGCII